MGTTSMHRVRAPMTSGWLTFAGVLGLVVGAFNVIDGLVGLFRHSYYLVGADKVLVFNSYHTWGWIWLGVGIAQILIALGVLAGQMWARVLGVILAMAVAIGHLAFLEAFPVWSLLVISLCVVLIYALTAPPARSTAA